MSEAQLSILNYALLALIYLFFARVLWAVWSEVRGPRLNAQAAARTAAPSDGTAPGGAPVPLKGPGKPARGRKGTPSRILVLEPKVRKGAAYPIGAEITLGRADSCTIGLPDDTFASQLHARVFVRDGGVWVEDLGSTNGTHLNGGKVTAAMPVSIGDRIQVGSTIFEAQ